MDWTVSLKDSFKSSTSIPVNVTLFGNGVSANAVKLRILKDILNLRWVLNSVAKCPYKEKGERERREGYQVAQRYRVYLKYRRGRGCKFDPWVEEIPWGRKWQPTPVCMPGKSHGQRSLMGYSLWDHNESDPAEHMHTCTHTHTSSDSDARRLCEDRGRAQNDSATSQGMPGAIWSWTEQGKSPL